MFANQRSLDWISSRILRASGGKFETKFSTKHCVDFLVNPVRMGVHGDKIYYDSNSDESDNIDGILHDCSDEESVIDDNINILMVIMNLMENQAIADSYIQFMPINGLQEPYLRRMSKC